MPERESFPQAATLVIMEAARMPRDAVAPRHAGGTCPCSRGVPKPICGRPGALPVPKSSADRAGEDARAEDYFHDDPALASDADGALELIYAEFVTRSDLGQMPPGEEWSRRFPQWNEDLQDLFQIHDLMKKPGAGVRRGR